MKNRLKRLNELKLIIMYNTCVSRAACTCVCIDFDDQVYIVSPALSMDLSQQVYAYNAIT